MACDNCGCSDITVPQGEQGLTGPTGPTGAAGSNGTNGVAILANQYPDLVTLGTAYESLAEGRTPYVMPLNTLSSNGDAIEIHAVFNTNAPSNTSAKYVRVTFNGSALNLDLVSLGSNIIRVEYDIKLTRVTNTTAKYELVTRRYLYGGVNVDALYSPETAQNITSLAGLNFTTTAYNIDVQGDSSTIGDIGCKAFAVLKYKI